LQLLSGTPLAAVAALDDEADWVTPVEQRPQKLLVAVDGSEPSRDAVRTLGAVVDAGAAEIIVVHVQQPAKDFVEAVLMDAATRRRREITRRLEAEQVLTSAGVLLARHALIPHRQIIAEGDPAGEILRLAEELAVELIVMGSRGRSGIVGLLLGRVSRKVLQHARCPVLIARVAEERIKAES
jgi:nucleotide-binding universal stress UspA family protein